MSDSDILISYHETDGEFVHYLSGELEKRGLHCWYLQPDQFKNPAKVKEKQQRLLSCRIYVVVLSPDSVVDNVIKDEMSLAYISNKALYPLGRKYYRPIAAVMDSGMKLMLAKINWTFFVKESAYEESLENLVTCIKTDLNHKQSPVTTDPNMDDEDENFESLNNQHAPFGVFGKKSTDADDKQEESPSEQEACEHTNQDVIEDFWERHFQNKMDVTFTEFKDRFLDDYSSRIEEDLGGDKPQFFVNLIYSDIFEKTNSLSRLKYNKFVGQNDRKDSDHFFDRLQQYAIGSLALKEVLSMDSSVRLIAIQNLGQYQTPAVIKLLFGFINDPDPNIRAIAGLSLAKSGKKSKKIEDKLLELLEDEDRVVRESACLSLAHLRCQRAVSAIVDLWRNDAIKHVREAAEIALSRIGGEEAAKAIKVTQVLQSEMTNLRAGKSGAS